MQSKTSGRDPCHDLPAAHGGGMQIDSWNVPLSVAFRPRLVPCNCPTVQLFFASTCTWPQNGIYKANRSKRSEKPTRSSHESGGERVGFSETCSNVELVSILGPPLWRVFKFQRSIWGGTALVHGLTGVIILARIAPSHHAFVCRGLYFKWNMDPKIFLNPKNLLFDFVDVKIQ